MAATIGITATTAIVITARTIEATVTLRGRTMAGMAAVMVDRTMAVVMAGRALALALAAADTAAGKQEKPQQCGLSLYQHCELLFELNRGSLTAQA